LIIHKQLRCDKANKKTTHCCVIFVITYFLTGFAAGFVVAMIERLISTSFVPLFGQIVTILHL
jgi:uncharacterized membrane protein